MFRFFRKHQWILIAALSITVISFLFWNIGPSMRNNGGPAASNDLGSIYGKKVSPQAFDEMRNEVYLFYLFNTGEWPDKNPNISKSDLERQIYIRLMLVQKAETLGIHVSDDAVVNAATAILHSFGRNGQTVELSDFAQRVLQPQGLTLDDFENFVRLDLITEQMQRTMGLIGDLITPQEIAAIYERENQELSTEIISFSASNYLSQVTVTPAAVAQFYTNYLAEYRLPDRVQVNYVEFSLSNYLAESKAEWAKTNLDEQVEAVYRQYGAQAFPEEKTPEAAKAKIRETLIEQRALAKARDEANEFATTVFNLNPSNPKPEDLATVAKQKGFAVKTTAPFDSQYGPQELVAPEGFTTAAFKLTSDIPFSSPIIGHDAVYVIALARQLPSEIPPLDQIHARVTQDFQLREATLLAQRAGTNFVHTLANQMAAGKTFAAACIAAGLKPQILEPFSLNTRELPDFSDRAELNQLKQIAFTTPVGHASDFAETEDGGFILFVQSKLPLDEAKMKTDLPQFTATLRRSRQAELFDQWLMLEANRTLKDTPIFRQAVAGNAAP
ncbi:MAG TPA: SurA N-terminal domain-containing protein [Verrucomicrobiae bacterium]|nr:SurA N-terminal domain-containing protein [Verrucomicrobiae bacterium]